MPEHKVLVICPASRHTEELNEVKSLTLQFYIIFARSTLANHREVIRLRCIEHFRALAARVSTFA